MVVSEVKWGGRTSKERGGLPTDCANMAPIKKRTTARAKSARAVRPAATLPKPESLDESAFASSKKDKQKIKHSSFVSKIEKSTTKSQKRRRPNKKLVANLESLADALSGLDDAGADGKVETGQAKIQRKSLKSRPGAMKRKEKLEKMEKERFNQNLVQLASTTSGGATQDRWAALKSHVQNNMEVKPEFNKTQSAT
ncbi:ribosome biogenesis protein SLX9 [Parastagonospora nodorum]|nr:ribosome biogenesis protein SLX9 [Parastagonospora nodorum]KAH3974539.1 ribosome biogenesis protein SLX9 [Parastagonospora nodorum]KAH3977903.1 ribosome biogenesis protein SLX9 [Parastagonospora nodorum]KAH3995870.1 ribosome biogenesis protein SLX9 [Parastagonospora nodorum]KAH4021696.1 ribosome biogenesis protein SLX9 [Parastagonospora nodorum]